MKNSNRLQQWVDKHPDRFSFFVVSIFALAFIAILVCLLIGELYLLFFLVGVGGGLFGYFVLKNADNNYDGYMNHNFLSDEKYNSSQQESVNYLTDIRYASQTFNIHHHDTSWHDRYY